MADQETTETVPPTEEVPAAAAEEDKPADTEEKPAEEQTAGEDANRGTEEEGCEAVAVTEETTVEVTVETTETTETEETGEVTEAVAVAEEAEVTEATPAEEEAAPVAEEPPADPEPEPVAETEPESAPEPEPEAQQEPEAEVCELTAEETETFQSLFDAYAEEVEGEDGCKKLTRGGIKMLFRYVGEIVTDANVKTWLEENDQNADGLLNFDEFVNLYSKKRQPEEKRKEEVRTCVDTLFPLGENGDANDISLERVSDVLKKLNNAPGGLLSEASVLTEEDIQSVIAKIDIDGSHSISRQEFVDFLSGVKA